MVISEAVEALWNALAPGWANETLPTSTLCTTVLQRAVQCSARDDAGRILTGTRQSNLVLELIMMG